MHKNVKIRKFWNFCHFRGDFSVIMGSFSSFPKSLKISTNTYHTNLDLCELNSLGDTLQFEYKFGAWQILYKKPVWFKYFSFPYGTLAENRTRRERLKSELYLRLKMHKTIFFEKKTKFLKYFSFGKCRIVPKNAKGGPFGIY